VAASSRGTVLLEETVWRKELVLQKEEPEAVSKGRSLRVKH
jgi:hypothetical protein